MEPDMITKPFLGVFSAISAIGVFFFNQWQAKKLRAELLEKLDEAISKEKKHTACELFRLIHGIPIEYSNLKALVNDDNSMVIVYVLKRYPGLAKLQEGKLIYSKKMRSPRVRQFGKIVYHSLAIFFGFTLTFSVIYMSTGGVAQFLIGFVFVLISYFVFANMLKMIQDERMIKDLVDEYIVF